MLTADDSLGIGRHPCPGMRFAKLENIVIVAFFLAYFDEIKVTDGSGKPLTRIPDCDINNHGTRKPNQQILLQLTSRKEDEALEGFDE